VQQLSRNLRQIEPLVRHGIAELQSGAPADHTLREIALMSTLVCAGATPSQAIRTVERFEPQLLGLLGPYERAETLYHPELARQQALGVPFGYGKTQFGVPMGKGVYGKQLPTGFVPAGAGVYGKQLPTAFAPTGAGIYGKQLPMTYAPSGKGLISK